MIRNGVLLHTLHDHVVGETSVVAVIIRNHHSFVGFELVACLACLVSLEKNHFGHDMKTSGQEATDFKDNTVWW